ncbi:hypothetical protein NECID01_1337 [Nematocida sp. AWRm77]|nr:hypothetical protein NECID01_1337 [Nematocida sp. AWRm77]
MTCESYISPNVEWSLEPSTWIGQTLLVATGWFIFYQLSSKTIAWSCTIVLYNIITFLFFHAILGDPFNQEYSSLTFWEQLMIQLEGSSGMIFFTVFPILLFLCGVRFSNYSTVALVINSISLVIVLLPKVRVFIKYYRYRPVPSSKTKSKKKSKAQAQPQESASISAPS